MQTVVKWFIFMVCNVQHWTLETEVLSLNYILIKQKITQLIRLKSMKFTFVEQRNRLLKFNYNVNQQSICHRKMLIFPVNSPSTYPCCGPPLLVTLRWISCCRNTDLNVPFIRENILWNVHNIHIAHNCCCFFCKIQFIC